MITKITMPKFGAIMEDGTIEEWLVELGQKVAKGDELAEVSTDKITNMVISPIDGYFRKIVADVGETVDCGEVIGLMTESLDEVISEEHEEAVSGAAEPAPEAEVKVVSEPLTVGSTDEAVKISPRAKKIAEDKGLDYSHIKGTGRLGIITVDDLKKYGKPHSEKSIELPVQKEVPAKKPVAAPVLAPSLKESEVEEIRKLTAIEKTTARTMLSSMTGMAQTTLATEANVENLASVYSELKGKYARAGVRLTYTALIIKAVAMTLEDHPKMRASLVDDEHIQISNRISIGVAVDLPDGNLIVPVIRDANMMDLRSIALKLQDLSERARTNSLEMDELGNATLTISNIGTMGITYFTPVINPPESSLLGIGAIRDQIVVENGAMKIAPVMYLSLTHDHRIINGGPAARFLQQVVESLQDFRWM